MRTIILTGATGGLGSVLAQKIMERSLGELICIYRNEKKFQKIFADQSSAMHPYKTSAEDDYKRLESMLAAIPTDEVVLILNAFSIAPIQLIGDYTCHDIDQMVSGNIRQNVVLLNEVIRICHRGAYQLRIINLDSGAADFPLRGWGNYCASKAYMNAFLSVVSLENQDYKVVSFDPGVMDTGMQKQIRETEKHVFDQVDQFISYKEEKQLVSPSVVAEQLIERYISDWKASKAREKRSLL